MDKPGMQHLQILSSQTWVSSYIDGDMNNTRGHQLALRPGSIVIRSTKDL